MTYLGLVAKKEEKAVLHFTSYLFFICVSRKCTNSITRDRTACLDQLHQILGHIRMISFENAALKIHDEQTFWGH